MPSAAIAPWRRFLAGECHPRSSPVVQASAQARDQAAESAFWPSRSFSKVNAEICVQIEGCIQHGLGAQCNAACQAWGARCVAMRLRANAKARLEISLYSFGCVCAAHAHALSPEAITTNNLQEISKMFVADGACIWVLCTYIACCLTPPVRAVVRKNIRPHVLRAVHNGMPAVRWAQSCQHPVLTTFFNWAACTVSVSFYACCLPPLLWVRT